MKKIAHVLVLPKMAGSQKFCHLLLSNITGYEKYVLVSGCEKVEEDQRQEFVRAFESIDVKIIWCNHLTWSIGKRDISGFIELYWIFKKNKFDVVHTNSSKPGVIARIAARFAGVKKIIHTVHGISFYKGQSFIKRFIYWAIESFALQFGDLNVCVNRYYLKYYKFFFWKKSFNIYNGYDFSALRLYENEINPDSNLLANGKFSFLFVGRLDKPKNPISLITAFSLLSSKYPSIHLDIVGDGELMFDCVHLVSNLNLQDRVTFHGWVNNPYHYFRRSHVFICPSIYEAFGFIFLEAAYYRKPIVATTVEGIPEVVINERMGLLVNPNDNNALAEKMELLMNSPELCVSMGDFGHNYVVNNFNIKKCVSQYQYIYDNELKVIRKNV